MSFSETAIAAPPLALAAGLETKSDHFIALAVMRAADKKKIRPAPIEDVSVDEKGITGKTSGKKIKIGS